MLPSDPPTPPPRLLTLPQSGVNDVLMPWQERSLFMKKHTKSEACTSHRCGQAHGAPCWHANTVSPSCLSHVLRGREQMPVVALQAMRQYTLHGLNAIALIWLLNPTPPLINPPPTYNAPPRRSLPPTDL